MLPTFRPRALLTALLFSNPGEHFKTQIGYPGHGWNVGHTFNPISDSSSHQEFLLVCHKQELLPGVPSEDMKYRPAAHGDFDESGP